MLTAKGSRFVTVETPIATEMPSTVNPPVGLGVATRSAGDVIFCDCDGS
jgi:hypothetical protein